MGFSKIKKKSNRQKKDLANFILLIERESLKKIILKTHKIDTRKSYRFKFFSASLLPLGDFTTIYFFFVIQS